MIKVQMPYHVNYRGKTRTQGPTIVEASDGHARLFVPYLDRPLPRILKTHTKRSDFSAQGLESAHLPGGRYYAAWLMVVNGRLKNVSLELLVRVNCRASQQHHQGYRVFG
jgi:hypothetical protein